MTSRSRAGDFVIKGEFEKRGSAFLNNHDDVIRRRHTQKVIFYRLNDCVPLSFEEYMHLSKRHVTEAKENYFWLQLLQVIVW